MIKSWVLSKGHIKVIRSLVSIISIPFLSKPQTNHKSLKDVSALQNRYAKGDSWRYIMSSEIIALPIFNTT